LICGRSDARYGYRIMIGKREPVPIVIIPNLPVDGESVALVAGLFGRHSMYMDGGPLSSSTEAWREAEGIYTELCLLAGITPDADAFVRQRQALTQAS